MAQDIANTPPEMPEQRAARLLRQHGRANLATPQPTPTQTDGLVESAGEMDATPDDTEPATTITVDPAPEPRDVTGWASYDSELDQPVAAAGARRIYRSQLSPKNQYTFSRRASDVGADWVVRDDPPVAEPSEQRQLESAAVAAAKPASRSTAQRHEVSALDRYQVDLALMPMTREPGASAGQHTLTGELQKHHNTLKKYAGQSWLTQVRCKLRMVEAEIDAHNQLAVAVPRALGAPVRGNRGLAHVPPTPLEEGTDARALTSSSASGLQTASPYSPNVGQDDPIAAPAPTTDRHRAQVQAAVGHAPQPGSAGYSTEVSSTQIGVLPGACGTMRFTKLLASTRRRPRH
jgi:hypothetical protein